MNVTQPFNKYLSAIYDVDDPIYKAVYSDKDGVPAGSIVRPRDFNLGAIANVLEWNRQLLLCLLNQIDLSQAIGKYLDFIAHDHFGIVRCPGETDADYVDRVQKYVVGKKISPAALIFCLRPFSTTEPTIQEGNFDVAYADVSYADVYTTFQLVSPNTDWVLPAISADSSDSAFFFLITLTGVVAGDIEKIVDIVDRVKAAGTSFEIQIGS